MFSRSTYVWSGLPGDETSIAYAPDVEVKLPMGQLRGIDTYNGINLIAGEELAWPLFVTAL
jgi:hypothetical protein